MADLSQQLRDYRLTQRKEKLATVGRIAGGILDIPLQGGVSGSVRRWSPPKDKPLTIREQLGAELKLAEKSQARSARNKASIDMHAKRAVALEQQMADLQPGPVQLDKTQQHALQELRREQAQYQGSKNEFPTDYLTRVVEKLSKYDGRVAVHIMNEISPKLVQSVMGEADDNLGTGGDLAAFKMMIADHNVTNDERAAKLDQVRADYNEAKADLQAAEAGEIRHGDGISGVDTGVDFSKSPPSSSQYSAAGPQSISRIQELYDKVPDNRKDSQKQHAALAADEKMRSIARGMGLNPDNSIQMDHFIKTMTKAEKKARKLYARAKKHGWTDEQLAEKVRASNFFRDPDAKGTTKQMMSRMVFKLMGIEDPNMRMLLAAKAENATIDPATGELTFPVTEIEGEPEVFVGPVEVPEELPEEVSREDGTTENIITEEEEGQLSDEEFLARYGSTREEMGPDAVATREAALGFKTDPDLEDADDSYEWQGVPEEDLAPRVPYDPDFNPDDVSLKTDESLQDAPKSHAHANWTPERIAARDAYLKAKASGSEAEALIAANVVRRLDGKPLIPQAKIDAARKMDAKVQARKDSEAESDAAFLERHGMSRAEAEAAGYDPTTLGQPQPLSFTEPRVPALQRSLATPTTPTTPSAEQRWSEQRALLDQNKTTSGEFLEEELRQHKTYPGPRTDIDGNPI